jgi:hypothetical protein
MSTTWRDTLCSLGGYDFYDYVSGNCVKCSGVFDLGTRQCIDPRAVISGSATAQGTTPATRTQAQKEQARQLLIPQLSNINAFYNAETAAQCGVFETYQNGQCVPFWNAALGGSAFTISDQAKIGLAVAGGVLLLIMLAGRRR